MALCSVGSSSRGALETTTEAPENGEGDGTNSAGGAEDGTNEDAKLVHKAAGVTMMQKSAITTTKVKEEAVRAVPTPAATKRVSDVDSGFGDWSLPTKVLMV